MFIFERCMLEKNDMLVQNAVKSFQTARTSHAIIESIPVRNRLCVKFAGKMFQKFVKSYLC